MVQELVPIHSGHVHIREHQAAAPVLHVLQRFLRARGTQWLVAHVGDQRGQHFQLGRIVVQNARNQRGFPRRTFKRLWMRIAHSERIALEFPPSLPLSRERTPQKALAAFSLNWWFQRTTTGGKSTRPLRFHHRRPLRPPTGSPVSIRFGPLFHFGTLPGRHLNWRSSYPVERPRGNRVQPELPLAFLVLSYQLRFIRDRT